MATSGRGDGAGPYVAGASYRPPNRDSDEERHHHARAGEEFSGRDDNSGRAQGP
ncbi:hypothetical protein [Streptomyces fodineus]|uniref:hypothetical protein n=1 Tax=Streptomyces fodineus TaxID=1904616 RepID=UPI00131CAC02|nr:hypothetical protein [Streptomyces fodineus]